MGDQTPAEERTVAEAIAQATEGWEPGGDREFDPEEYAWAYLPCPSCGDVHLTGVLDPDDELEPDDRTFVVLPGGE